MLGDRANGKKRVGLLLLATPVLLAGSAFLASNDVPVSYAGIATVDVAIPTHLTVLDDKGNGATVNLAQVGQVQDSYHFAHVSVHLASAGGSDVGGEAITFTSDTSKSGAGVICRATTDSAGTAGCGNDTTIALTEFSGVPTKFIATFAGDGPLQASTISGDLTSVGHGKN